MKKSVIYVALGVVGILFPIVVTGVVAATAPHKWPTEVETQSSIAAEQIFWKMWESLGSEVEPSEEVEPSGPVPAPVDGEHFTFTTGADEFTMQLSPIIEESGFYSFNWYGQNSFPWIDINGNGTYEQGEDEEVSYFGTIPLPKAGSYTVYAQNLVTLCCLLRCSARAIQGRAWGVLGVLQQQQLLTEPRNCCIFVAGKNRGTNLPTVLKHDHEENHQFKRRAPLSSERRLCPEQKR